MKKYFENNLENYSFEFDYDNYDYKKVDKAIFDSICCSTVYDDGIRFNDSHYVFYLQCENGVYNIVKIHSVDDWDAGDDKYYIPIPKVKKELENENQE